MTRLGFLGAIATLMLAARTPSWAATNLNSSKSNVYRLIYPADLASQAQANALLAELDKLGAADEARLKQWLAANFKRLGISPDRVVKILVRPGGGSVKQTTIILLTNPADEAHALAVSDAGAPADKSGKSSK